MTGTAPPVERTSLEDNEEGGQEEEGEEGEESEPVAAAEEPADPLYDPTLDDEDEVWMQRARQGRVSDAILNCPGCFTTLCIDCQQHEEYKEQYRAMFVINCQVEAQATVKPTVPKNSTGKRGRSGRRKDEAAGSSEPACHQVCCGVCGADVGVMDPQDGLYIFYNVFPSNA